MKKAWKELRERFFFTQTNKNIDRNVFISSLFINSCKVVITLLLLKSR